MEKFRCTRKMGGEELSLNYQKELDNEIQEFYGSDASLADHPEMHALVL